MKKLLAITFSFFIATVSLAQKNELKAAEKAIKNENFADAKAAITQAEPLIASADQKSKAKFYFLKGKALYANGAGTNEDIDMALTSFDKLLEIEQSGKKSYTSEVNELKGVMVNSFLTKANEALQQERYMEASNGFEKSYRLSPKDTLYLYYAASVAVNAQEFDPALKYYQKLKELGYSGVEEQYVAISKETGEEEIFNNKSLRDISVKAGTHIKPSSKKSEPRSAEIVKNIALIYISKGDNEKAMMAMKDARTANPDDLNLLLNEANIYFKMGDTAKYKELITQAATMDPDNPELLYNLGVITSDAGDPAAAKGYYQRAIDLDPTYVNAQINMAALILAEESTIVEQMNGLGSSAADDRKYDELKAKRTQLYSDAIPYLVAALEAKPNNLQAAKTLMNIYSAIGDTVKFKELQVTVESIENGGN